MSTTSGTMRHTSLDYPRPGIALLTLHHADKSVNLLSREMLEEFERRLGEVATRADIQGLVITSGKTGSFIAGADLAEFAASLDEPPEVIVGVSRRGQELLRQLASLPMVTIATIDGVCVGGGAELAVWCDRRILTLNEKTQIGFPEVKLGLYPGWGGTARTPRMIGLANAVELITGGESIGAEEAYKLGLANDLVATSDKLLDAAERMIRAEVRTGEYRLDREKWSKPIPLSETELAFLGATGVAVINQQTGGNYPAPMAALELMLEASQVGIDEALTMEAERFAPLFGSPVNRSLLNVFFLQDRNKKSADKQEAAPVRTIGVVGAGTMGLGIAAVSLRRGLEVTLTDNRAEALVAGEKKVLEEAAFDRQTKGPNLAKLLELSPRLHMATDAKSVAVCEVVVEAIIEQAEAKRELFARLEASAPAETILCSNTSTIPIAQLAKGSNRPENICGLHFFNPVRKMPLVEVIRGPETSDKTITRATGVARQLGKTPIVVADGPGFLVNRLLLPYMNEAAILVGEGAEMRKVEKAAKAFGLPMGPLELHDVVGLDVCLHAGKVMQQAFADRVEKTPLVEKLVESGRLGQKNGRGFYDWQQDKKGRWQKQPSEEVANLIAKNAAGSPPPPTADLTDRLLLPMLVEATRAIEDGIVNDVRDVDLALILGIGFPPFKGGLFHWADTVGASVLLEKLESLSPLGKRYEPTAIIRRHAEAKQPFYAGKPAAV
jgi:3-hydroxyacyl-CoA dehydrogenase/enoyl-CoA hydratase/carnithine racemase